MSVTSLSELSKTDVTSVHYLYVVNSALKQEQKFALSSLFPTVSNEGTGTALYKQIASKNQIQFRSLLAGSTKLSIAVASDDITVDVAEANIDLSNCDNTTSAFLSSVALGSDVTGTLPVANGGTGTTSLTDKAVVLSQLTGTDALRTLAMTTNGSILIGGTSGPVVTTLTAGDNVTISNTDGGIEISASLSTMSATLDMANNNIDLGTAFLSSDGTAAGLKIKGNTGFFGDTADYFSLGNLNLTGDVYFKAGTAVKIKAADGTSPATLTIEGADNDTTNGTGAKVIIKGGAGVGTGNGGDVELTGGTAGGSGSKGNIIADTNIVINDASAGFKHTAPGSVTQTTDHSTGVTVNSTCGTIQLAAVSLASGAEEEFTVTNSTVAATSLIFLQMKTPSIASTTDDSIVIPFLGPINNGSFDITLRNVGDAATTTTTLVIHFLVINTA